MTVIIYELMEAKSLKEVNGIVKGKKFDPTLLIFVDNAKRRIRLITAEKKRSWASQLN